jgi:hypothetical protein
MTGARATGHRENCKVRAGLDRHVEIRCLVASQLGQRLHLLGGRHCGTGLPLVDVARRVAFPATARFIDIRAVERAHVQRHRDPGRDDLPAGQQLLVAAARLRSMVGRVR